MFYLKGSIRLTTAPKQAFFFLWLAALRDLASYPTPKKIGKLGIIFAPVPRRYAMLKEQ